MNAMTWGAFQHTAFHSKDKHSTTEPHESHGHESIREVRGVLLKTLSQSHIHKKKKCFSCHLVPFIQRLPCLPTCEPSLDH